MIERAVALAAAAAAAEDLEAVSFLRVAEGEEVNHRCRLSAAIAAAAALNLRFGERGGDLDLVERVAAGDVVALELGEVDGAALVEHVRLGACPC